MNELTPTHNPEYIDIIERCIDSNGLQETIQMLSSICWEKADHVLTNQQDKKLARAWEAAATSIDKLSVKNAILAVS